SQGRAEARAASDPGVAGGARRPASRATGSPGPQRRPARSVDQPRRLAAAMTRFVLGETELEIDERAALALDVAEVQPGSFVLRSGGSEELFHCVRVGNVVHLWWRGVAYRLEEAAPGQRTAQRHAGSGLEAPM